MFDTADLDGVVAETVRRIGVAGFWALWRGETVRVGELIDRHDDVVGEAVAYLRARGRIELDGDGRLLAVHGLTRRRTLHRVEHAAGAVNTWCALDAVGIPAALSTDARAVTRCPTCQRRLEVVMVGGEPEPGVAAGVVLWYPETTGSWGHLVDDFCSGANLFCSLADLQASVGDATGAVMTVEQVADLGRKSWADVR